MAPSSNQRIAAMAGLDRPSSLPVELINMILRRLPLMDVARTSALSKFWSCRWMLVPDLIFDGRSIPVPPITRTKRIDFVNHVLFLHEGNVSRFEIKNYLEYASPDVDRWIRLLSRKLVRELVLGFFHTGSRYKLPSLFLCQNMRLLKLNWSILNMPSHVEGFRNLVDLDLRYVTFTNETIARLVANCPLQRLILISCDSFNRLSIYSQSLRQFSFYGPCEGFNFGNTPNLRFAYIGMLPSPNQVPVPSCNGIRCTLEDVLGGLINVVELRVGHPFLKILVFCRAAENSYVIFPRLIHVSLEINLDDGKEIRTAISLLGISPCLQTMTITNCLSGQVINVNGGNIIETQLYGDYNEEGEGEEEDNFPRLAVMKLDGFRGRQLKMSFLQFILSNARVLQTMSIMWAVNSFQTVPANSNAAVTLQRLSMMSMGVVYSVQTLPEKASVLESLLPFERASPGAKVVFLN